MVKIPQALVLWICEQKNEMVNMHPNVIINTASNLLFMLYHLYFDSSCHFVGRNKVCPLFLSTTRYHEYFYSCHAMDSYHSDCTNTLCLSYL